MGEYDIGGSGLQIGQILQETAGLKGQCHEIFCCWFFHESVIDAVGKFATGVVDTGGAPGLANISANFRKKSKQSKWNTLGLGVN